MDEKRPYLFQADANALGGVLRRPVQKVLETLAPVSLSPAGGLSRARSEAFNLDDVVRCSTAYTTVTGCECETDGSISILATAVVEDLNILEVVTARRIVARAVVTVPKDRGCRRVSFVGTGYEGLRLGGRLVEPKLSLELPEDAVAWAKGRNQNTARSSKVQDSGARCSLVDPPESSQCIRIPGFGRVFLAELLISPCSLQFIAIRVELDCPTEGHVSGPTMMMISGTQDGGHG